MRVVIGEACQEHDPGFGFPEGPDRLEIILDGLSAGGNQGARTFETVGTHAEFERAARAVHEPRYLEIFRNAVARGDGLLGSSDNPLTAGTYRAAVSAASAAMTGADRACGGDQDVFVAVRPPGHHAESKLAMGFCYLNNVAIAAQHLIQAHGIERVAIFDFDVHHGNGTQEIFYDRGDVLYASTHQFPFYPGTGAEAECGTGPGTDKTVNVPLPAGTGDDSWLAAIQDRVLPALEEHAPQALLLSAGFDAWSGDPLGGFNVTEEGFAELGRAIGRTARRCGSRLVSVLEGGYDRAALARLIDRYAAGLAEGLEDSGSAATSADG